MKRFLSYLAVLALTLITLSCKKDESPISIDFSKNLYTIYVKGSTNVELELSENATSDLSIPLIFSGKATLGQDFSVSSQSVIIKAGENKGSVTIQDKNLSKDKQISISFKAPSKYKAGNRFNAVVSVNEEESLIYSFKMDKANVYESYIAQIELTGTVDGKNFKAKNRLSIPIKLIGEAASYLHPESNNIIVEEGSNTGKVKLNLDKNYTGKFLPVVLSIDNNADPRYIPSDVNGSELLTLVGKLSPDKLVGTWEFKKIYDKNELVTWFTEMEDDASLLPLNNDGFQITISKDGGKYILTTNGKGDFANFFRKSEIKLASPKNGLAKSYALGDNSLEEQNQFMHQDGFTFTQNVYFELAQVNRDFSKKSEKLGSAIICMNLVNNNTLQIQFRDYDTPPFGEMWWDSKKFDGEMFGFASEYQKVK